MAASVGSGQRDQAAGLLEPAARVDLVGDAGDQP
jgi:hypothetical protein